MKESLRKSGIDIVGDVPWGTRFCQIYQTKEDLVDTLIPYFKTGLENNEFCIWVTSQPLEIQDAKEALGRSVSNLDTYLEKGQIQIIHYNECDLNASIFDPECVLSGWVEKFNQELNSNYDGIRFSWNIPWLGEKGWNRFIEYKKHINNIIDNSRMIALFTYSLDSCNATEIIDLIVNHQFALIKREGECEQIEGSRRKKADEAAFQTIEDWEQTFDAVPDLITIIDNRYRIVRANRAMAAKLGVTPEKCIGLTCYRAIHKMSEPPSFCPHKQLLEDRLEHTVEVQEDILGGLFSVSVSPLYDAAGKLTGCVHIARDITDHKQIEESLRESEAKYRNIIETANEGILITDAEFRAIYVNKKMEEMLGYNPEEMIGKSEQDFTDEKGKIISRLKRKNIAQGINESFELRFMRKDGSSLWALVNTKSLFDKNGKFIGALAMVTDITKHKQEEHRICRYNRILEGINWIFSNVVQAKTEKELGNTCLSVALEITCSQFGFINEIGVDGLLHDIAKSQLGWENCLIYDKTGHRRPPNDFVVHGLYGSVVANKKGFFTNDPSSHPDSIGLPCGHPPITSFLGVPLLQEGETMGLIAVANREGGYTSKQQEDLEAIAPAVTQALRRKRSEEALRLSNNYNRSLIEASLDPLVTIGPDGKITDVNEATELITGYSLEELIGTDFSEYFIEPKKAKEGYQHAFKEGLVRDYPLEIQHKDGHITPVLYNASVYKDETGKVIGVFAAARDITELKKAEEKIRMLASAVESSEDAIVTKSLDGIISSWNKGAEKVYGYSAEEVLGKNISIIEPVNLKGEIERFSEKVKRGELIQHYETSRLKKDGTSINVSVTLSPVFDASGELVAISTIGRNITERKKAEEALRLSNIYNRSLIEAGLDPLVTIGPDGKITDVNGATELITGYSRNELIGTDFSDYFTEPEKARAGYQQVFVNGEVRDYPLEIEHKDGNLTPVLYNASVYKDETGKVIGVFAAARDITERKKAEEAVKKAHDNLEKLVKERTTQLEKAYNSLKESERGLAEAQRMAHVGNWEWNLETGEGYWSNELYRIFGRSPQKSAPSYNQLFNYILPEDRDYVDKSIKRRLSEGSKNGINYRIILDNGEERIVHARAEVVFKDKNIPVRVKGIIQDITESKKAEEKIQILVNAVESSNDAIVTLSLDSIITSWNKGAEQIYGYSAEDVIGKNISIVEPDSLKGEIERFSEKIKQGQQIQHYETLRLNKHGKLINISAALSPVFNASGKLVAILAIARDITERIKAEEALVEIDKIRIKEIHHRIKNNLQVISSLLDLQAEKFQDREVLEAFRESQNRVISMALIHEELYKGEGCTLNFSTYLQKLAENLFQTYSLRSKNISLLMDLEDACFDIDIAVPLGIIVNELVSNALKHAFSENEDGEIRIKLCREEKDNKTHESTFSLTISDNGKGIPENIELESLESLGLKLVNILVNQIDGKLELKKTQRTEFRITFNVVETS